MTEKLITARSSSVPCAQAAMTPSGIATRMEKAIVEMLSASDGPMRPAIMSQTGIFEWSERPKSPDNN